MGDQAFPYVSYPSGHLIPTYVPLRNWRHSLLTECKVSVT
jgi:hypothetical protein